MIELILKDLTKLELYCDNSSLITKKESIMDEKAKEIRRQANEYFRKAEEAKNQKERKQYLGLANVRAQEFDRRVAESNEYDDNETTAGK